MKFPASRNRRCSFDAMDDVSASNDLDLSYCNVPIDLSSSDVQSTLRSPLMINWHQEDSKSESRTIAYPVVVEDSSWRRKPPTDWTSFDILNWIYSIEELLRQEDLRMLRGERFQELDGRQLCRMTLTDFLDLDPNYGHQLYDSLNQLRLLMPMDDTDNTFWLTMLSEDALSIFDEEFDEADYSRNVIELLDEEPSPDHNHDYSESCRELPGISIFRKSATYGITDSMFLTDQNDFEVTSYQNLSDPGYQSGESSPESSSDGSPFHPGNYGELPTFIQSINDLDDLPETEIKPEVDDVILPTECAPTTPVREKRRPGRPRKRDTGADRLSSCDGEFSKHKNGNKTKSVHLWEFMRSLLNDPIYNPDSIRWENKQDGVFRIVPGQSKVIAQLWGQRKNNPSMTFDKLSRSLRWCRTFGFLSEVPKNGMYPKKLCFRFGKRASSWDRS